MTGLRPGEAKGLKVKDLDVVRGRLMIRRDVDDLGRVDQTKTRDHRDVPIDGELLHQLASAAEGRDMEAWLLPDEKTNVWTTARCRVVWKNLQVWCGLEGVDTYELRHTAASLAIAACADVKTVQRMLGHASAAMTLDVYGHLWEEGLDQLPGAMEKQLESQRVASAVADAEAGAAEARRRRAGFRVA
ncbi:tyrosine-type recombinase/integrase [Corynebacterium falsenii]|uniref:tyrosine-type recombinase/integrase n=1 Tax=Corynebacterium falsenii TaxID=108486 RepID=UPI0035BE90DA